MSAPTFSPDYRWCRIGAREFSFTSRQAQVVEALHGLYLEDILEVGSDWVMADLELPGRLVDLFRRHDCWGSLLTLGNTRGTVRLNLEAATEIQRCDNDTANRALDNQGRSSANGHRHKRPDTAKRSRTTTAARVTRARATASDTVASVGSRGRQKHRTT